MNDQARVDQLTDELTKLTEKLQVTKAGIRRLKFERALQSSARLLIGLACIMAIGLTSWAAFAQKNVSKAAVLTVAAPFVVVDTNGRSIFAVQAEAGKDRGAFLHSSAGKPVVDMVSDASGGRVSVRNEKTAAEVSLSAAGAAGNPAVSVTAESGHFVRVSRSSAGGGFVGIGVSGKNLASMGQEKRGTGVIAVSNKGGHGVVNLGESETAAGAGRVLIGNQSGAHVVRLVGTAPPYACVSREGAMECLAVDLPLSFHLAPK